MKYLLKLIIVLIVPFINSLAQEDLLSLDVELYIGTEGVEPLTKQITFYMDAQSPVFGDKVNGFLNYNITNKYDRSSFLVPHNNNHTNFWRGWQHITVYSIGTEPIIAFGLYKFSTNDSNAHFYIDYRDNRYTYYNNS